MVLQHRPDSVLEVLALRSWHGGVATYPLAAGVRDFGAVMKKRSDYPLGNEDIQRFIGYVSKRRKNECWPWSGGRHSAGYGAFKLGRRQLAHRIAWMIENDAAIPDGLCVLHSCDNPPCCNPTHLHLGTRADNAAERTARKRGTHGEQNPQAKLTKLDVLEIRRLSALGITNALISEMFRVNASAISMIRHRKRWGHV